MGEAKERHPVKVLACCLMSNPFHLLLKPARGEVLSRWMQWRMTSHGRRCHRHYGSSGHVWQGRFKSFRVEQDEHLLTAMRYVEGNPVCAGMVTSARQWQWASHLENFGLVERTITDEGPIKLPADWAVYVNTPLTGKELSKIKLSIHRLVPFSGAGSF